MNKNKRIGFNLQYTSKKKIKPFNTCHICGRYEQLSSCLLCSNPICSECSDEHNNYCIYCRSNAPQKNNSLAIRVPSKVNEEKILYVKVNKKSLFCCFK